MASRCYWLLLLIPLLAPGPATACTIPVFRYALERWQPSTYQMLVFHHGPLTDDQQLVVRQLEDFSPRPNLTLTRVDLKGQVEEEMRTIWSRQNATDKQPRVVLRYPDADAMTPDVWSGPLDRSQLAECLISPSRKAILDRIGRGDSAVFLLLESGDAAADQAAAELLQKELPRLQTTVPIPVQDPEVSPLRSELPLRVSFPVVRLGRTGLGEGPFVRMLLNSEPDLAKVTGPIVFAIFGRGRLLCSLLGDELNAGRLGDVARFLCGACSCRVKELNPGVDLLMAADWEHMLDHSPASILTGPPAGDGSKPLGMDRVGLVASAPADTANAGSDSRPWLWAGIGTAVVLVIGSGAWALSSLRRKPERP